jgi:hypothetical protein
MTSWVKALMMSSGVLDRGTELNEKGTDRIDWSIGISGWCLDINIPDRLQISGRVDGGGGLRVEEEADLNREAPSSPLTKYSYSDEPSKPACSKKRTKKLPQPPPVPPAQVPPSFSAQSSNTRSHFAGCPTGLCFL